MSFDLTNLSKLAEFRYKKLEKVASAASSGNRIVAYFPEVSMVYGFPKLSEIAKKGGVNVQNLKRGEMVLFTNKAKTACKIYVGGDILLYQKAPDNMRLIYSAILAIPAYLNGGELDLKGAVRAGVIRDHDNRTWRRTGVVTKATPIPAMKTA